MYLEHFQLKSQPFSEHTAVSALWQDQRMDEGLARLEYLIQCGQLGLVTGPSGVGKSALLKRFLHDLLPQHCQALYCHLAKPTDRHIMEPDWRKWVAPVFFPAFPKLRG